MNHHKFFTRLFILFFWITVLGMAGNIFQNLGNVLTLGWHSLLLYAFAVIVVLYIGIHLSLNLWKSQK